MPSTSEPCSISCWKARHSSAWFMPSRWKFSARLASRPGEPPSTTRQQASKFFASLLPGEALKGPPPLAGLDREATFCPELRHLALSSISATVWRAGPNGDRAFSSFQKGSSTLPDRGRLRPFSGPELAGTNKDMRRKLNARSVSGGIGRRRSRQGGVRLPWDRQWRHDS